MIPNASTNTADAWSLFWASQGPRSRCLAGSARIAELLDRHWRRFAENLSPGAPVLDLGCGAGVVGRALLAASPGLNVTGIDLADIPSSAEAGLRLISGTAMESLPFASGSFDAVVSQFGFEYADPLAASREAARVLAPGGRLSLLIHHPQGPIVAAMRRDRRVIEELCGLRIQAAFFSGDVIALGERIRRLKQKVANDALIDDAERGLHQQIRNPEHRRLEVWKGVVDALAPELVMLDSLELACVDSDSIDRLIDSLENRFDLRRPQVLQDSQGEPVAWIIDGSRRPDALRDEAKA